MRQNHDEIITDQVKTSGSHSKLIQNPQQYLPPFHRTTPLMQVNENGYTQNSRNLYLFM